MRSRIILLLVTMVVFGHALYVLYKGLIAMQQPAYRFSDGNIELSRGWNGLVNWVLVLLAVVLLAVYKDQYPTAKGYYTLILGMLVFSVLVFLLNYFVFFA